MSAVAVLGAVPLPLAAGGFEDALARAVGALRIPVLLLALAALLVAAVESGRLLTEWWRRRSPATGRVRDLALGALRDPRRADELSAAAPSGPSGAAVARMATALGTGTPRGVERALAAYELDVQRRLDRTRLLVRAGPALGLMGTLIPLAPGLAALGRGDVASLAEDLRTAFAATVVGLLVGTVAFGLTLVRTRFYSEDLAALEEAWELHGDETGAGA